MKPCPDSPPRPSLLSRWRRFLAAGSVVILLAAWLGAGCAVGPDYHRPETPVPTEFRGPVQAGTNSIADLPWWGLFRDPDLQGLISAAMTNNYDLQAAIARVDQARYQITVARSPLFPQLGYGGTIARGKNASFGSPSADGGQTLTTPYLAGQASWEIDLWGRIRRLTQAAQAQYLVSEEGRRAVMLSLVSEMASDYFELLALDRELVIQREATNAYTDTLKIFQDRLVGGVSSRLETDRATAALAQAAATIPDLERRISATENAINLLAARLPGPIVRSGAIESELEMAPDIPAGLPSALLERRPDIRAAEQQMVSANALIGVRKADFFPQISLTALFGKVSPEVDGFTAGSSTLWSVAAGATGPIFQGGRIRAQYHAAEAAYNEARANYEQTVLNSFREVSDALVARQKFIEVRKEDEIAVAALTSSVKIATDRYLNGRSGYFEVLEAQQQLYPTQAELTRALLAQAQAVVQLYRVLGGGWNLADPQWIGPEAPTTAAGVQKP